MLFQLTDNVEDGTVGHSSPLDCEDLLCGNAAKCFAIVIRVRAVSEDTASGESSLGFSRQRIVDDEAANGLPIERPSDGGKGFGVPDCAVDLVQ